MEALRQLQQYDLSQYTPAVIPSDGRRVRRQRERVCPRLRGDGRRRAGVLDHVRSAEPGQLEALAELTNARVFDGREDLVAAFRSVKGYN